LVSSDAIKKVKGFGFEIETTLREAKNTIEDMRELAKNLSKISLFSIAISNRHGPFFREKHENKELIIGLLKKFNLDKSDTEYALSDWNRWMIIDHFSKIRGVAPNLIGKSDTTDIMNKIKQGTFVDTEDIKNILNSHVYEVKKNEVDLLLEDYDYFLKNKKIKREDTWFKDE